MELLRWLNAAIILLSLARAQSDPCTLSFSSSLDEVIHLHVDETGAREDASVLAYLFAIPDIEANDASCQTEIQNSTLQLKQKAGIGTEEDNWVDATKSSFFEQKHGFFLTLDERNRVSGFSVEMTLDEYMRQFGTPESLIQLRFTLTVSAKSTDENGAVVQEGLQELSASFSLKITGPTNHCVNVKPQYSCQQLECH